MFVSVCTAAAAARKVLCFPLPLLCVGLHALALSTHSSATHVHRKRSALIADKFRVSPVGVPETAASSKRAAKRPLDTEGDELEDSQLKALMTRKERKMFEGLRKIDVEKAERVAELENKKNAIKKRKVAK